ncbi:Elongator subunit elp2 [Spiromyces aspiralis]|uniref:Elongator subunit elp2 n=1 Tax=Spiromyces aspiralis TaxID=68401 RepID=A0ACC1HJ39_9FUNG|nr:Elongator subunit elp2 [Spiromyces aspiralis]
MTVALSYLPNSGDASPGRRNRMIVLATGNTDLKIHIYVLEQGGEDATPRFVKATSLSGHEDWVTDLSFYTHLPAMESRGQNSTIDHWRAGDVVLASASQDKIVRLWRFTPVASITKGPENSGGQTKEDKTQAMIDALAAAALGEQDERGTVQLSTRAHAFCVGRGMESEKQYTVSLDALLTGHDNWVHSVKWLRDGPAPKLLTASADQSAIVWYPDPNVGVWSSEARLGEVGGATGGFLGADWNTSGTAVLANGYHGTFHLWRKRTDEGRDAGSQDMATSEAARWVPDVSISGHYESVQDVCWEPNSGRYLLSLSLDQTARVFAPWVAGDSAPTGSSRDGQSRGWHEIARPQIHGYDLRCAAFVSSTRYISGADEKVVRVFEATQGYVDAIDQLSAGDTTLSGTGEMLPRGASLPALGLSNKAIDSVTPINGQGVPTEDGGEEQSIDYIRRQTHIDHDVIDPFHQSPLHPIHPPLEEALLRSTLWPEIDKLYGHPYEIFSVAVSNDAQWAATACKAAKETHAGIRIYSTRNWKQPTDPETNAAVKPLLSHSLTITRLRFSPNDEFLLSVSRDRAWSLFRRTPDCPGGYPYCLFMRADKAHTRIIWDSAWTHDGRAFVTASRDKTVKVWATPMPECPGAMGEQPAAPPKPAATIKLPDAVVSADFAPARTPAGGYCLAVGLENGRILLLGSTPSDKDDNTDLKTWSLLREIDPQIAHVSMIHRLSWRSLKASNSVNGESWYLASASDDQTVRIYSISF